MAFRYFVTGTGDNVSITYLTEDIGLVEVETSLPWRSEEVEGTKRSPIHLEVEGPADSRVVCFVETRPIDGTYDGDGSGRKSQYADSPGENQNRCEIKQDEIGG